MVNDGGMMFKSEVDGYKILINISYICFELWEMLWVGDMLIDM